MYVHTFIYILKTHFNSQHKHLFTVSLLNAQWSMFINVLLTPLRHVCFPKYSR